MTEISKTYIEFRALPQYNIVNEGPIMHHRQMEYDYAICIIVLHLTVL